MAGQGHQKHQVFHVSVPSHSRLCLFVWLSAYLEYLTNVAGAPGNIEVEVLGLGLWPNVLSHLQHELVYDPSGWSIAQVVVL